MSETPSSFDPRDELFGPYLDAIESGKDPEAVLGDFAAAYPDPDLIAEFRRYLGMVGQLAGGSLPSRGGVATRTAPPPPALPDFEIEGVIGQGGMGVVYKAKQLSLNRLVALKVNAGQLSPDKQRRFEREQRVLARLHQTHIAPVHTAGQVGPWQYFAMAYIDGAALHHIIKAARRGTSDASGQTPPLRELIGEAQRDTRTPEAPTVPHVPEAGPTSPEPCPPALSPTYFRSVADVLASVGLAVDHAHKAGVLHRDIKPANIMVDTQGRPWVIDFGLAGLRTGGDVETVTDSRLRREAQGLTGANGGPLGTLPYMAPEQFEGEAFIRSDVWGLGCTLYELLTLRPAFHGANPLEVRERIRIGEPEPVEAVSPRVPKDLTAICRKALKKAPGDRYASAADFAADLRRWLNNEPTVAAPPWPWERCWMWAKRNPGWAMATLMFLLLIGTVFGAVVREERTKTKSALQEAELQQAQAEGARKETAFQQTLTKQAQRESAVQELLRIRLTPHDFGWSKKAWSLTRKAAEIAKGSDVRDQAAATLAGLDARPFKRIDDADRDVSFVAFDPEGRLLYHEKAGARLWDPETDRTEALEGSDRGAVSLRDDGTPLLLSPTDKPEPALALRDLRRKQEVGRFKLPLEKGGAWSAWSLTDRGDTLAAAVRAPDGSGTVIAWDVASGKELWRSADTPSDLALAPTAAGKPGLLALAYGDGRVVLRTLPDGREVAKLRAEETAIYCLAFGRNPRRRPQETPVLGEWLLATGHLGGTVTVWDLGNGMPLSYLRGSMQRVTAVAFSPDGVTLASAGRDNPKLWDVATGQHLLNLQFRSEMRALAFSRDGKRLAVGSSQSFGPGGLDVHELEEGRGMRTLRGLSGRVHRFAHSADGRLLAGFSENWQVGLWDLKEGRLLHILDVPHGEFPDNASFAFSPDGKCLAFSAFKEAGLWDVASGKRLETWSLPLGFCDRIVYPAPDQLLLLRVETTDARVRPYGLGSDPKKYPRICLIRNLLGGKALDPISKPSRAFDWHVFVIEATPQGKYFVAEGLNSNRERRVIVWDALTGKVAWSRPSERTVDGSWFDIDPTGELMTLHPTNTGHPLIVEVATGKIVEFPEIDCGPIAPRAEYTIRFAEAPASGFTLHRRFAREPLVGLALDIKEFGRPRFSPQGGHIVWGSSDGTVTVCDIQEIRTRLADVGLGW